MEAIKLLCKPKHKHYYGCPYTQMNLKETGHLNPNLQSWFRQECLLLLGIPQTFLLDEIRNTFYFYSSAHRIATMLICHELQTISVNICEFLSKGWMTETREIDTRKYRAELPQGFLPVDSCLHAPKLLHEPNQHSVGGVRWGFPSLPCLC